MLDVVETLRDLVKIPSVNPMGRDLTGPEFLEAAMTDHLERLFQSLGWRYERHEVEPQRSNIIARIDGAVPVDRGGSLLMFEAHQDTVPVDGMTIPPWTPDVRDGRVYGRGSCDIKGGMACMLAALSRLADQRPNDMPTIVLACTVNEEHGYSGATHLADLFVGGKSKLVPRRPDAVIVAEPTALNVVVTHKGVVRWKCHTTGRACHSSQPHQGVNAIYRMGRVLSALAEYADRHVGALGQQPLLGSPTLSVGTITGGISVNTVPDRCTIEIDRRLLPGEQPMKAYQHVVDFVAQHPSIDEPPQHDAPYVMGSGLPAGANDALAERLARVAKAHGGPGEKIGVPYGTDAPAYAEVGAPTVVFGPGHIEQAHTKDEWIAIEQLERATEIYYQFAKTGLMN